MMSDRTRPEPLFIVAAALLAATLVAAIVVAINGSLADAGDDILPLLGTLAAIAALAGWYREKQAREQRQRALEQQLEQREAEKTELKSAIEQREAEKAELFTKIREIHEQERRPLDFTRHGVEPELNQYGHVMAARKELTWLREQVNRIEALLTPKAPGS